MADTLRGWRLTIPDHTNLRSETCITCGTVFALAEQLYDELQRRKDRGTFYCPNGHRMCYQGKTTEQKLADAQARETALGDQLRAAIREGDAARAETLRIRQRIANGVCPCCTRSFPNVMRHMATQHPEFAVPGDIKHAAGPFKCSCGHKFETFRGLRIHQGQMRDDDWDAPKTSRYWSHLSVL